MVVTDSIEDADQIIFTLFSLINIQSCSKLLFSLSINLLLFFIYCLILKVKENTEKCVSCFQSQDEGNLKLFVLCNK